MSRYLSFKALLAVCAFYAFGAFVVQILQGNFDPSALGPLFTGESRNAVLPQPDDPAWMWPYRMMGLGTLFLVFAGMFVFQMVQSFLPATLGMLAIILVLRRLGEYSYAAFAVGGLACGLIICAFAGWRGWELNMLSMIYITVSFGIGAMIYRAIAGHEYITAT